MINDNEPPTRAELEVSNKKLKDSVRKCEALLAECQKKLDAAETPMFRARRSQGTE